MKRTNFQRREFLGAATLAGASLALPGLKQTRASGRSANETIRIGIVGPGGRGSRLMKDVFTFGEQYNARLTAVCDIWKNRRETSTRAVKDAYGKEPKVYRRLDDLLADNDIDAVIIATADHQHGQMLEQCVAAGKDVYCEKPMANQLRDANRALDAVNRSEQIVQIGTQRRAIPKYRRAAKLMREGILGDVVKVDVIWNAYSPYRWAKDESQLKACKQADLDWTAFLMGKADRPFDPRIYRSFRLFRDFSSGIIDQWMTHAIDAVHMLAGQQYPNSVVAHGGIYQWRDYRENPDTMEALLEYGEGEKKFLTTYATTLVNETGRATRVLGTHGTLEVEEQWRISGNGTQRRDRIKDVTPIEDEPDTLHHMANWLDCVRRRDTTGLYCPASAGYGHSIACIMSSEALWSGQRMVFDSTKRDIRAG